jgi:hypothetical protein
MVKVNYWAFIKNGICSACAGKVIAYNAISDEVEIMIDEYTRIITTSNNIRQDLFDKEGNLL